MAETLQFQLFLVRLKRVWQDAERVMIAPREKNTRSMSDMELTAHDVRDMCLSLRPKDLVAGPVPHDAKSEGDVWVFHPVHKGTKMYLKLWLRTLDEEDYLEVISCHREGML